VAKVGKSESEKTERICRRGGERIKAGPSQGSNLEITSTLKKAYQKKNRDTSRKEDRKKR